MAIDPVQPTRMFAAALETSLGSEILFRTDDGGMSWAPVATGLPSLIVAEIVIDPINTEIIYLATVSQIARSIDGGSNWSVLLSSPLNTRKIAIGASGTLYAGTVNGVFKSDNQGTSWTGCSAGLTNANVISFVIDPNDPQSLYAGTVSGGVFKSTNACQSWRAANRGITNLAVETLAVDPFDSNTVYAGTRGGGVFMSRDRGESWVAINNGLSASFVEVVVPDPFVRNRVYAGTDGGGIFKTDLGVTP